MKADRLIAVCVPVVGLPHIVDFPHTTEAIQAEVGGHFEIAAVSFAGLSNEHTLILCNEDGAGLPRNLLLPGLVGDCLVVARLGPDLRPLSEDEQTRILAWFHRGWSTGPGGEVHGADA